MWFRIPFHDLTWEKCKQQKIVKSLKLEICKNQKIIYIE
jgi:hypothetical protein